jgi:hypothetical protein
MTKMHFEAIAAVLHSAKEQGWTHDEINRALAGLFGDWNPRFDTQRFLTACGTEEDK